MRSLIKRVATAVAVLGIFAGIGVVGCSPANSPTPSQAQAAARGVVLTAEAAWLATARACVDVAAAADSETALQKCQSVLDPARDALIAAASAVDAWNAASQSNFPCLIKDAIAALVNIKSVVGAAGTQLPQVVTDALVLAQTVTPQCVIAADGGAQ